MKIHLLFIFLLFIVAFSSLKAQNYPYLNASTGNEGQYVIDADTNIYMYHGDQIEKVDKNFNPIWVKTYSGLLFHNLLMSKTGSLYFISENTSDNNRNIIGKITADGNIEWCKIYSNIELITDFSSYTAPNCSFYKLILDRNNNLIFSGSSYATSNSYIRACLFLKTDTLGNVITYKNFSQAGVGFINFTVLDDSSGVYKFAWDAGFFESAGAGGFKYSELLDSIISPYSFTYFPQFSSIAQSLFLKSKLDTNCYYSINQWYSNIVPSQHNFLIVKHYKDTVSWAKQIAIGANSNYSIDGLDEDGDKNLLFTLSPAGDVYYKSQLFKFDSMGIGNQSKTLFTYIHPWNSTTTSKLNVLYGKSYFYDVYGYNFPATPLSVTLLDSSLTTNCATSYSYSVVNGLAGNSGMFPLQVNDVTNYSETANTVVVSSINNYSVDFNYCLALSAKEIDKINLIDISPNPVSQTLNINSSANFNMTASTVFDVNGKIVLSNNNQTNIDVSSLSSGLYFIKVKTDQGEFSQKFIKE